MKRNLRALISQMTLKEKIGQLNQCGNSIYNEDYKIGWKLLREGRIGSLLGITDVEKANELQKVAVEETRLGIPLLLGLDVIHGYRTIFPVPMAMACTFHPELSCRMAQISAKEARANGVTWIYAPMIDVIRDARWGRGVESAGEDPYLVSEFAKALVQGTQGSNLADGEHAAACAKHFLAYGAAEGGKDYNSVDMSWQTLYDTYLPPFRAAVDAGVESVMTAFHDLNGEPCTGSRELITNILRKQLKFHGVVISDAGSCDQLKIHGFTKDDEETAEVAFKAGLDVEMCFGVFTYQDHLEDLVKSGRIPEKQLDAAVLRVLKLKEKLGLFDHPFSNPVKAEAVLLTKESRRASLEAARKAVVLLENQSQILPIRGKPKMALIGPMADDPQEMLGTWSCLGRKEDVITVRKALEERFGSQISYSRGCGFTEGSEAEINQAAELAGACDIILVFLGEPASMNGEGKSRTQNVIPSIQMQLLEALQACRKPLIVSVTGGRPLVLTKVKELADALLFAGALGIEAGNAYVDVLSGMVNPGGKLVQTFPTVVGQAPLYYNHHNTGKPPVEEFFWTSKYMDAPIPPLYPFGYGLHYGKVCYENLRLSRNKISREDSIDLTFEVTNLGEYEMEETVLVFLTDPVASLVRPVKELKKFVQVQLKPEEKKKVTVELKAETFGFYNRQLKYVVEPGEMILTVGSDAEHGISRSFTIIE